MKPQRLLDVALIPIVGLVAFGLLYIFDVAVPAHFDFGQLYRSITGLANGQGLYQLSDTDSARLATQATLSGEIPFPGPPWYIALGYPLHLLSLETAAKAWLALCLCILYGAIQLATPQLSPRARAILFILATISAPVQGHLIVGQFTLPALYGVAWALSGIKQRSSLLCALGLALSTCRPHLGIPLAAATVGGLLIPDTKYGVQVAIRFLLVMALLLGISLAVDPHSLSRYPEYLRLLNNFPSNQVCDTCSSIPILAERLCTFSHDVWQLRFLISAAVALPLVGFLYLTRPTPDYLIAGTICAVMLSAPYIRNYDFVLLVVPFCVVAADLLRGVTSSGALAVVTMLAAYTIAALLPYGVSRDMQGQMLLTAPALMYLLCVRRIH
jgi:hypothetical protein